MGWWCHKKEKEKKGPTVLVSLNGPGRCYGLNELRKNGFPKVVPCPLKQGFNLEMFLGGADD